MHSSTNFIKKDNLMAILTVWDNRKQQAVRVEFESEWTWDDLEQAITTADQFIASVSHEVDIIIDLEGSSLPKDFMNGAKKLLGTDDAHIARANEGRRIVIGANQVLRSAYQTIQKTFADRLEGREVLFADSLPQARAILHSLRMED